MWCGQREGRGGGRSALSVILAGQRRVHKLIDQAGVVVRGSNAGGGVEREGARDV